MHSLSMIHGDLKPQNILITNDHQIKVCDLGLSKVLNRTKDQTITNGGTILYMPLE